MMEIPWWKQKLPNLQQRKYTYIHENTHEGLCRSALWIGVDDAVIYLLHRSLVKETWRALGVLWESCFLDFSSAFNTIHPSLLRGEAGGSGSRLPPGCMDHELPHKQAATCAARRLCVWCGSLQRGSSTGYSALFFPLYTLHIRFQLYVLWCVTEGNDLENRKVITNFVSCASKTKEVVIDFRRKAPQTALVNIQGLDIEIVEYKYLGVHINNKLDWTHNTDVLYKKGQSRLHLLRRLRSFGVFRSLVKTFYDSVVASAVFYTVVCWGCGSSERDRRRRNKLVKRAGSVLDCPLDSIEEVGERRMLAKLTSIMDNPSHPLHETVGGIKQLLQQQTASPKRNSTAGVPTSVRLFNNNNP